MARDGILEHGDIFRGQAQRRMGGRGFVTAKQCICAALVKGCQHIKRDSGNAHGDPGGRVNPQNQEHVTGRDSGGAAQTALLHSRACRAE